MNYKYIYIYIYLPLEPTQGLKTSEFKVQGPPRLTVTSDLAGSKTSAGVDWGSSLTLW